MKDFIVELPNRDIIEISIYDYTKHPKYEEYFDEVKMGYLAKELCRIDNILEDDNYWKYNNYIRRENIFGNYCQYNKKSLISYKKMLLTSPSQIGSN